MAERSSTTKGTLARLRRELSLYQQVLPSLELKRQQFLAERTREARALEAERKALEELRRESGSRFPMLAGGTVSIGGLARVERIESVTMRILGTPVPQLINIHWKPSDYGLLAKPHWVDGAIGAVQRIARRRLEIEFAEERMRRLDRAIRKVVQRVNLFERVLIPRAKREIERVRITLADAERAAVVRSKIFKSRHQAREARP